MARIAGIDIPREKRVEIALTYIYGIGLSTSQKVLAQANVNPDTRVRHLTDEQVNRLRDIIDRRGRSYDYVIIDCPPTLGILTVNALAAAAIRSGVVEPMIGWIPAGCFSSQASASSQGAAP